MLETQKLSGGINLPSLLIVDDDPLICDSLRLACSGKFDVRLAERRPQAISLLRQLTAPPQLALMDLFQFPIKRSIHWCNHKQSWLLRRCWHGHFNFWTKLANCPWSFKQNYYVETALMLADSSISEAAKLLGLNRTTLYSRMEAPHKHKAKLTDSRVHNN